jgi:hypothetical protein
MNEKDDKITHPYILSKPQNVRNSGPFCNSPGTGFQRRCQFPEGDPIQNVVGEAQRDFIADE